jgi:2,4-dienoyl-CoA reductase-like NADH-dependent reductase (Old Yellow Enzyme family)
VTPAGNLIQERGFGNDGLGGLTLEAGLRVVAELDEMGLDRVETSGGVETHSGRAKPQGRCFRSAVWVARKVTRLPVLPLGGLSSRVEMEDVLSSGDADFVSLYRPLICEPDLPNRLRLRLQARVRCISCNRCRPERMGEGITCKCAKGWRRNTTDGGIHDGLCFAIVVALFQGIGSA